MDTRVQAGDIFLTYGESFLSAGIRFFTRGVGEKRTKVNHVGIIVTEGTVANCRIVESISRAREIPLLEAYGPPKNDKVAIYRAINMSPEEIQRVVASARRQVGKRYGYFKVLTHLLDWCLLGAYVFRRLARDGNYPICSWLVAHAFEEAGKDFGVTPGAASPDDIWDFVSANHDKYTCIQPLTRLQTPEAAQSIQAN